jgi:hypothetical protein
MMRTIKLVSVLSVLVIIAGAVELHGQPLEAKTKPPDPHFNRLNHNDVIIGYLKGYAAAYPDWVKLESIGKSSGGSDMWLVTLNNPKTGPELSKPAMYVDGATHANEVQGSETILYTLDYLLKNYGKLERVTELMDRAVFYFLPIVNPDSRAKWFDAPSNPNFPRTVPVKIDDDRDGRVDEDGYEDMDGDGEITQMRKKVPLGQGRFRLHPKDPRRLVVVEEDELGDYIMLGGEGIDNDGDGRVNEDNIGFIDPNRTWAYGWQPRYVQPGTTDYPFQIPETRSIALWSLDHPNIAAIQSFHNTGRMILRGPGSKAMGRYEMADIRAYDRIGKEGENILPGYNYYVVWKDLYTAYGGTIDYFYGVLGAIAFSNELFGPEQDFDKDGQVTEEERLKFADLLTQGRMLVDWKEMEHPQYGTVEIGGFRHDTGRVPEGWMLEEECHRNSAFVLYHAYQMPKIRFGEPLVEKLDGDLYRLHVPVINERAIPTVTAIARKNKIHRVDLATVEGAAVVSSGIVQDPYLNKVDVQKRRPERLMVPGVDGLSTRMLFFLVEGKGKIRIDYDSVKAGKISTEVELR